MYFHSTCFWTAKIILETDTLTENLDSGDFFIVFLFCVCINLLYFLVLVQENDQFQVFFETLLYFLHVV